MKVLVKAQESVVHNSLPNDANSGNSTELLNLSTDIAAISKERAQAMLDVQGLTRIPALSLELGSGSVLLFESHGGSGFLLANHRV